MSRWFVISAGAVAMSVLIGYGINCTRHQELAAQKMPAAVTSRKLTPEEGKIQVSWILCDMKSAEIKGFKSETAREIRTDLCAAKLNSGDPSLLSNMSTN